MPTSSCRVIEVDLSVIEQREAAVAGLRELAEGRIHQLILWVPALPPLSDEELQRDPFSVFARIGAQFPAGDGDDYASICRKAKPDHIVEINGLFADGEPSFETIDALDKGTSWPRLKTLLGVNSPKEILLGLLSPTENQENALKGDNSWVTEARDFIQRTLGLKLRTKGQKRQPLADEL
jgi:hypothetical protein